MLFRSSSPSLPPPPSTPPPSPPSSPYSSLLPPATCRAGLGQHQQQLAQLSHPFLEPSCQLWSWSRKPHPVSRMTQLHLPTSTPASFIDPGHSRRGKSQHPLVYPYLPHGFAGHAGIYSPYIAGLVPWLISSREEKSVQMLGFGGCRQSMYTLP